MKLLIMAYYFPPLPSTGSFRLRNIFEHAQACFDDVFVITTDNAWHFGPIESSNIFDVYTLDYRTLLLKRKKFHPSSLSGKSFIGSWLRSHWGDYTLGEGGFFYIKNAVRQAARLIKNHDITHILSSFSPMADSIICHSLKKKFPDIIWIADFRDLPIDRFKENVCFPDWHLKKYRKRFRLADRFWCVSQGQKELLDSQLNTRFEVVQNGFPKHYVLNNTGFSTNPFTISYTGSLYAHYPIETFIAALCSWCHSLDNPSLPCFQYAGKDKTYVENLLKHHNWQGKTVLKQLVSQEEAWQMQKNAHINILFSWYDIHSKGILTSKVFEYLGARKPILVFQQPSTDPELENLLLRYQNETNIYNTVDKGIKFIDKTFIKWEKEGISLLGEMDILKNLFFHAPFLSRTHR